MDYREIPIKLDESKEEVRVYTSNELAKIISRQTSNVVICYRDSNCKSEIFNCPQNSDYLSTLVNQFASIRIIDDKMNDGCYILELLQGDYDTYGYVQIYNMSKEEFNKFSTNKGFVSECYDECEGSEVSDQILAIYQKSYELPYVRNVDK